MTDCAESILPTVDLPVLWNLQEQRQWWNLICSSLKKTYGFLYFTAKDMYPEELCIIVTFSECKTVALRSPIMPSDTEEDLVDRVVSYFSVDLRI